MRKRFNKDKDEDSYSNVRNVSKAELLAQIEHDKFVPRLSRSTGNQDAVFESPQNQIQIPLLKLESIPTFVNLVSGLISEYDQRIKDNKYGIHFRLMRG